LSFTVSQTVDTGGGASSIQLSNDGSLISVSNYNSSTEIGPYFLIFKCSNTSTTSSNSNKKAIGIGVGVGVGVLVLASSIILAIIMTRRKKSSKKGEGNIPIENLAQVSGVTIHERIGEGNSGEVYLGSWQTSPVVLKKLKDQDHFEEFKKEAVTLSSLAHPNVVQFLGIFTGEDGTQYIVTEYMPKGSIHDILKKEKDSLTTRDLLEIALGTANGMAYLSSANIIHRSLTARNLLVSKQDGLYSVKISDFALSRMTEEGRYTQSSSKTPIKWTAPEVFCYGEPYTHASDVWSYGIVLWEIMESGKEPFDWLSDKEAFQKIPKGEILPSPENCPEGLYDLMKSCWNLDPKIRPSFDEIVAFLIKMITTSFPSEEKMEKKGEKEEPVHRVQSYERTAAFLGVSLKYLNDESWSEQPPVLNRTI